MECFLLLCFALSIYGSASPTYLFQHDWASLPWCVLVTHPIAPPEIEMPYVITGVRQQCPSQDSNPHSCCSMAFPMEHVCTCSMEVVCHGAPWTITHGCSYVSCFMELGCHRAYSHETEISVPCTCGWYRSFCMCTCVPCSGIPHVHETGNLHVCLHGKCASWRECVRSRK